MTSDSSTDRNKRHKKAMQRKKAHIDERIAKAATDKGLIVVLTGPGKGKKLLSVWHVSAQCRPRHALWCYSVY